MSKFSVSQVLNMLNDMDSEDAITENTQLDDTNENAQEENGVPLNLYDSNELPESFVQELNNENLCLVSEDSIDVFMNLENAHHGLHAVAYCNSANENMNEVIHNDAITPTYFDNTYDNINEDCNLLEHISQNKTLDCNNNNQEQYCNESNAITSVYDNISDMINDSEQNNCNDSSNEEHLYSATLYEQSSISLTEQVIDISHGVNTVSDQNTDENDTVTGSGKEEVPGPSSDYIIGQTTDAPHDDIQDNENEDNIVNRGRKRVKDQYSWEKTIRKRRRQAGEEYKSTSGKQIPKKIVKLKKNCQGKCRKKCAQNFCKEEIECMHCDFWALSDSGKLSFYAQTTEKRENKSKKENSTRKFTFDYFFYRGIAKIPVCKDFYLGVLNISDNRIRKYYEKVGKADGNQFNDMRGKGTKQRKSEDDVNVIRNHIESFPRIPSHYCRSSCSKEFLEPSLSLAKMYDLYKEHCKSIRETPLKINMYRKIFDTEYNIGFHIPKKDRCDFCEEVKVAKSEQQTSNELLEKYNVHSKDKVLTKNERDKDRKNEREDMVVVSFDLENVILLPKSNVSNFFYKRKLSTYNLTAHSSIDRCAYNCIWHEAISGRGANDIASALVTVLKDIKRAHPEIMSFILWSDACVPQNKNSVMSFALKRFMEDYNIETIVQKFGCPGHSSVQEVDNIHSNIERITRYAEIYSPIALIRNLKAMRRKGPVRIIQMQKHNFIEYQKCTLPFKFNEIPYTKVKSLKYDKRFPFDIGFKLSYSEIEFRTAHIEIRKTRARTNTLPTILPRPAQLVKVPIISSDKKKDITCMLKYMPEVDRQFYKASKLVINQ